MKRFLLLLSLAVSAFAQNQTTNNIGLTIQAPGTLNWAPAVNQNFVLIDTAIGALRNYYKGAWSSTYSYSVGQTVTYNGAYYLSLINSNQAQTPSSSPSAWFLPAAPQAVPTVFGRAGAITALVSDYSSFYDPLGAATTAVAGIATATGSVKGLLAAADWTTFNSKQPALGFTPENSANKGAVSGYAPLGADSKVPSQYLPTAASGGTWGSIGGVISAQSDLYANFSALNSAPTFTGTVTAPLLRTNNTTPDALALRPGTGSISALPVGSAAITAPDAGGTAYGLKLAQNGTQGILLAGAAVTTRGITEYPLSTLVMLTGVTPSIGGSALTPGTPLKSTVTTTGATTAMGCQVWASVAIEDGMTIDCAVTTANTVVVRLVAQASVTPAARIYTFRVF